MLRNPSILADKEFDLIVIGGGIHGICVARDAAMRGMTVAMVERGDFGGETSHNSLKIVHGGIRYIQHFDFRRMRESARERSVWLKIASHLVRPLKCAIQTHGHVTRGPEALWIATRVHELIGGVRHNDISSNPLVPRGGVVGRRKSEALLPGLERHRHNGAAFWYDGQMLDADRIMIECLESAVDAGAAAVNYAEVRGLIGDESRVRGVVVEDKLTGERIDVLGKMTVNTAGPWADCIRLLGNESGPAVLPSQPQNLNMNIVTRGITSDHAIGVKSERVSDSRVDRGGRLFFITPWRGLSVIGTTHEAYDGSADDCIVDKSKICDFVDEINKAYSPAELTYEDVLYCYWGLTPAESENSDGEAKRARHGEIVDHRHLNDLDGLISVVAVKWTTARLIAERVVDMVSGAISGSFRNCTTHREPLPGAASAEGHAVNQEIRRAMPEKSDLEDLDDLAIEYGTQWRRLFEPAQGDIDFSQDEIFRRKVHFAVRSEMAVRLSDVLCRRTNLLQRGRLHNRHVNWSLELMASVLNWSPARRQSEIETFEQHCERAHATVASANERHPEA